MADDTILDAQHPHAEYICVKIDTLRMGVALGHLDAPNEISVETRNKLSMIKDRASVDAAAIDLGQI